jgi:hypothetical protein
VEGLSSQVDRRGLALRQGSLPRIHIKPLRPLQPRGYLCSPILSTTSYLSIMSPWASSRCHTGVGRVLLTLTVTCEDYLNVCLGITQALLSYNTINSDVMPLQRGKLKLFLSSENLCLIKWGGTH